MDIYQCPSCFKAWTSYTYLLGTLPLPSSFLSLFFPLPPPLFSLVLFSLPLFSFPYLSSSSFSSLSLSFSLFLSLLPLSPFSLFLPSPSFSLLPLSPFPSLPCPSFSGNQWMITMLWVDTHPNTKPSWILSPPSVLRCVHVSFLFTHNYTLALIQQEGHIENSV